MKKDNSNDEQEVQLLLFDAENEDDVEVDYLNSITDTVTWSTDWTVESIVSAQKRQSFNINPAFQRRDAWNDKKKSRFIESLIFGLPVPQIVLAEDKSSRGKYLLVDGKQRLLTLFSFFADNHTDNFKLTGLKSKKINGLSASDLETRYPDLYNNLLNQSIRSIVIKNWSTENLLYTIFFRLNSGSLPLSPQELRKALKPGEFLKLIDQYCTESSALKFLFGEELPDPRMRDMDLILRFFVMTPFIGKYKGNYKAAVDEVCDYFNQNWTRTEDEAKSVIETFEDSIAVSRQVFGDEDVFRRKSSSKTEKRINRALFDIVTHYFSKIDANLLIQSKNELAKMTENLCLNNTTFIKAISSNTNNIKETATRFVIYGTELEKTLKVDIDIPKSLKDHYSKL